MDSKVTWKFIIGVFFICLLIGIAGELKAQSYQPAVDTAIIYSLGEWVKLPYEPDLQPNYELDQIAISKPVIKQEGGGIKGFEFYGGTPWIAERNKSAIIGYLVELIGELMEPGETITIKKAKQ